jgi:hypothetical protein
MPKTGTDGRSKRIKRRHREPRAVAPPPRKGSTIGAALENRLNQEAGGSVLTNCLSDTEREGPRQSKRALTMFHFPRVHSEARSAIH